MDAREDQYYSHTLHWPDHVKLHRSEHEYQRFWEGVKKREFYGQADRKVGGTAPSLTVSKCENFDLFFPWNMIL